MNEPETVIHLSGPFSEPAVVGMMLMILFCCWTLAGIVVDDWFWPRVIYRFFRKGFNN